MADTAVAVAQGGGEPATVPAADSPAAPAAGGGDAAGAAAAAAGGGGGGEPATDPAAAEKRASGGGKDMAPAPSSNIPVKEPLGPGPFGLDDFDAGVTLGTGSFGRVRIATHKTTQTPWAIKILKKAEIVRMQQVGLELGLEVELGLGSAPAAVSCPHQQTIFFLVCPRGPLIYVYIYHVCVCSAIRVFGEDRPRRCWANKRQGQYRNSSLHPFRRAVHFVSCIVDDVSTYNNRMEEHTKTAIYSSTQRFNLSLHPQYIYIYM